MQSLQRGNSEILPNKTVHRLKPSILKDSACVLHKMNYAIHNYSCRPPVYKLSVAAFPSFEMKPR